MFFITKFHLISAVLIIVIITISYSDSVQTWQKHHLSGNTFNWVVKIVIISRENSEITPDQYRVNYNHCTGSIISEWHILTAAHCFQGVSAIDVSVIAGLSCIKTNCINGYKVKKIHRHLYYGNNALNILGYGSKFLRFKTNDVAILTLNTSLPFGEEIGEIPLPTRKPDKTLESSICKVAGWLSNSSDMYTQHLFWADIIIDTAVQNGMIECDHDTLICGRHPDDETSLSSGDSGGGLMCEGVVAGILTNAPRESSTLPTIFESVHHFLPFINGIFREDRELLTSCRPRGRKYSECICL